MKHAPPYGLLLVSGNQTHQENYARAFAADGRCRLIGLTDGPDLPLRRQGLNLRLAAELDIPFLADFVAAIHREDVDIVCLCPEPERRGNLAAQCVRAGKHIYVDKPIASSTADARAIVAAVDESGVKSQMFSLIRSPLAERTRSVLESGRLGELVGVHCELLFAKGIAGTADLSKPRAEHTVAETFTFIDSKRELFCVGLYPLVLLQWLTGTQVENVYGTTSNYFFAEHQRNDVEDFSCLLMRMTGGVDATITVGRSGWSSHPSYGVNQVHLVGTEGVETIDAFRPRLEIHSDAAPWRQPETPHPEDPMGFWSSSQTEGGIQNKTGWWPIEAAIHDDASYFLDCIEHDRQSDVPAAVGAHAVEVIMAGYESAASGRTVTLPAAPGA